MHYVDHRSRDKLSTKSDKNASLDDFPITQQEQAVDKLLFMHDHRY